MDGPLSEPARSRRSVGKQTELDRSTPGPLAGPHIDGTCVRALRESRFTLVEVATVHLVEVLGRSVSWPSTVDHEGNCRLRT